MTNAAVQMPDLYASEKETADTVTLAVRMPRHLRDGFGKLCESKHVEMAVVIRRFIERELLNQPPAAPD